MALLHFLHDKMQLSTRLAKAEPTTWLLIGAFLQCLLALVLPFRLIILLAALLLAIRQGTSTLKKDKSPPSPLPLPSDTRKGRWTAQMPHKDGSVVQRGSEEEVVVFVVGVSSSQYASSILSISISRRALARNLQTDTGLQPDDTTNTSLQATVPVFPGHVGRSRVRPSEVGL